MDKLTPIYPENINQAISALAEIRDERESYIKEHASLGSYAGPGAIGLGCSVAQAIKSDRLLYEVNVEVARIKALAVPKYYEATIYE